MNRKRTVWYGMEKLDYRYVCMYVRIRIAFSHLNGISSQSNAHQKTFFQHFSAHN